MEFDRDRVWVIVEAIADRLEGDWLLLGGSLVAAWLDVERTTEDIDVVGIAGCEEPRLRLLELADALSLPVETVNSAADFFVRRIQGWDREVELLHEGRNARVFRPTPTLFLLLKIGRLSERDLADCLAVLAHARDAALTVDRDRVRDALGTLPATGDETLAERRARLAAALG